MTSRTDSRQQGMTDRTNQRADAYSEAWEHYDHHYWSSGSSFAAGMLLGAMVASIPRQHQVVYVSGSPYYYSNGVYYVQSGSQYQVVPAPTGAVVDQPPAQTTNV